MLRDENKDVLMMREVLDASILTHKADSKERGKGWQKVAETLKSAIALSSPAPTYILLMIHHEETWLTASRNPNPNPKEGKKVQ